MLSPVIPRQMDTTIKIVGKNDSLTDSEEINQRMQWSNLRGLGGF